MKLRNLLKKDARRMLEWMQDPNVNYWFRFDASGQTTAGVAAFIEAANINGNAKHFAIADDDDLYLGTVSLKEIDLINSCAEYAIVLRGDQVGRGIAKFATDELLKIAFNELNLNRVYLNVLTENVRAWKFYEKYGFVFEGESRQALLHRGERKNLKWYSLLKEDNR